MKTYKTIVAALGLLILSSCGEAPKAVENENGWTFCSCNNVYFDTKAELSIESDPEEREMLEMELEIMEKECGEFLSKASPGTEEYKKYALEKIECK